MIDIISRAGWGARPPTSRATIATPTPQLWLHHSAGSESGPSGVRGIQNYHMNVLGWTDIAYSFLIDRDTFEVFEGRGAGIRGGHTFGRNDVSHGICVMGNFENTSVSAGLLRAVAGLVRHGSERSWWSDQLSGGHRDVRSTACPGRNLYAQIDEINRLARTDDDDDGEDEMVVRRGDGGEAVRKFQVGLKGWNPQSLPRFGADGDFGEETETWVRNFQTAQDLQASGAVDGVTAALLLEYRADDA